MSSKYIYDGATRYPEATELEKAVPKYGPMLRFECLFNAFNITKPIFSYGYVRGLGDKKLGKREGQLMIHVPWRDLMQGGFKVSLENWLPPTHEGANFIAEAWNSSVSFVRMPTDWELPELPGHGPVKRPYLAIHITKLDWRKKAGLLYNTLPSNLLAIFHPEEAGRLKSLIDASQKSDTTSVRKTFAEVPLEPKDWPEFNLELTPSAAADVTEPVVPTVPPLICSFVTAISDLKKSVQQREDESQREKWASNYDADADDNADRKHQRGREILEEALYRHDERENLPTGVQPEKCNRKLVLAIRKISIDGETAWPEEFGGFDRMPVTLLVCAPEGSIKHKVARDEIATLEFDFPLPNIAEVVKILGVPKDMEGIEFKLDDRGHALMNCSQFTAMQKAMTMTTNLYIHVPLENPTTKAVIRNLSLLIDQAPKLISTHLPQMEFVVRQDSLQLNLTSPSLPSLSGDTALAKSNVRQQHKAYRRLDHEQRAVVDNVFNAKPSPETNRPHYVAVQGPPGTGKTTMATVLAMLSYHAICQARVSRNNPDWLAGPQIILTAPTKAVTRLLFGRTVLASRTETAQDDARFHFLLSTPKSLDKVNDDDEFKKYTLMGQITALAWHIKRKVENDFMAKCFKEELVVAAKRWTSPRETGDKKSRNQAQHTLTVELYKRCIVLATTMDHFQAACENFDVNAAIVIADEVAVAQVPSCIPFIFHAAPITVVIGDNKQGRPYKSTHQNLVGKLLSKLGSYQLSTQYRCREAQYLVNQAGIYSRKVDSYVSIKEVSVPYDHLSKEYDNVFDAYYIKPTSSVASADAPDAPSSPSQPHKSLTSVAFADVQGSSSESHKFLASNSKQIASNSKAVHCPQNDSEVIIDSMIFKALRTANNASWLPEFHDIKGRHSRQGTSSLNIEQTTAMINLYKKAIELGADPPSKDYIASRFLWLSYYRGQAYYAQDELQKAGLPLPRFSTVAKAQGDEAPFVFLSLTKITDWISSVEHQMDAEKDDNNNKAVKKAKKPSEPINLSELSYPNLMKWTEYRPGEFTLSAGSLDVAISRQKVGLFVFGNLDLFKRAFAREVKLLENDAELAASIQDGKRLANVVTNTTSVIHIRPDMEDEDEDKGARSKDQRPMRVKSDRPRSNRRSQAMSFMFRKPEEYGTVEGKISPKANIRTSDDWGNGNDNPDHAVDSTANSVSDHTTANVATSGTPSDATAPTGTVIDPTANVATSGTPLDATAPSAAADVNGKKKMSRRNHRGSLKLKNNGAE